MRIPVLCYIAAITTLSGCQTHASLRDNTLKTSATLSDLHYQQVLNNVALFTSQPSSLPSIAVINSGTVTVADQKTVNSSATYVPTETFAIQATAGLPILALLLNPSASRNLTENWSMTPVNDIDSLRRIRCAFQLLVLNGGETSNCEYCHKVIEDFFPHYTKRMECLIPTGWYGVGCKRDVPKGACHVGHSCDTYVWVMPDGVEGLTRFTMTVMEMATGKSETPMKTVVKTYKSDGKLDTTQVTTTEIDREAIEKMKKEGTPPRRYLQPSETSPGLFFVPRPR